MDDGQLKGAACDVDSDLPVASQARSSARWLVSFRRRALSAAVLIPIILGLVWVGGWVDFAAMLIVLVGGLFELRAMFLNVGWRPLILLAGAASLAFILTGAPLPWFQVHRDLIIQVTFTGLMALAFLWLLLTRQSSEQTIVDWALTLAIPFYLGWPLALLLLTRGETLGYQSRGFWWMALILLTIWANDAAAYLTGHFFGKTKFAPRVSPAKTWEGFFGGLVFSVITVFVVLWVADLTLRPALAFHLPWYALLLLGALICVFGTLGDLAESLLKRGTRVKDSGTIFPGHGGMLDRADSLLFATIAVYFFAYAFHLLV